MTKKQEPWISANDAAEIISKNSGKPVHPDYVRLLARQHPKKLASKPLDGRTNVYLRSDVEQIKVRAKKVTDRKEVSQTSETTAANPPVVEEQPWYLPEKEESASTEEKSEPEAA